MEKGRDSTDVWDGGRGRWRRKMTQPIRQAAKALARNQDGVIS